MRGARLSFGKFENSTLTSTQLSSADHNLSAIELRGAYLEGAQLQGVDLRGAKLQGAELWLANLEGADLSSANLDGANLRGADLKNAKLSFATLEGADLREANLEGANLDFAHLGLADLRRETGAHYREVVASSERPVLVSMVPPAEHPDWFVSEPTTAYTKALVNYLASELASSSPRIATNIAKRVILPPLMDSIGFPDLPIATLIACRLLSETKAGRVRLDQAQIDDLDKYLRGLSAQTAPSQGHGFDCDCPQSNGKK